MDKQTQRKIAEGLKLLITELLSKAKEQEQSGDKLSASISRRDANQAYQIGEDAGYLTLRDVEKIFKNYQRQT